MIEDIALEPIFEGSKYLGCIIGISETIEDVDQPVDLTGADIVMQMTIDGTIHATYKTIDNTLQISNEGIIIPSHIPTLKAGTYKFDFSIIMPNGDPYNGVASGVWEILKPTTIR
ncbi:MAG: hypothetical protein JZU53_06925 [Paludibacter sp.]|nr:hypothetical protein [Paludibacter sp.]